MNYTINATNRPTSRLLTWPREMSDEAAAAVNYINAVDPTAQDAEWQYTKRYIESTDIVPDWLIARIAADKRRTGAWHKWTVGHNGKTYTVAAPSERAAVNFVRFKLYGTLPLESLAPFTARRAEFVRFGGNDGGAVRGEVAKRLMMMRGHGLEKGAAAK